MNELNTMPHIPVGYRRNAQDHLVPTNTIKPVNDMREELVNALFDVAALTTVSNGRVQTARHAADKLFYRPIRRRVRRQLWGH